jgi:hypothetical protein
MLLKKLKEKGLSWKKISDSFPGRDWSSCKARYNKHINEGEKHVRADWSKQDSVLLKKLKEKGLSWKKIAESFPERDWTSCKDRYNRYIKKGALHPSKGATPDRHHGRDDSSDDDEGNSSSNEDDNVEVVAASEPSPAASPRDDDVVLPPVISSSSAALTYFPSPLLPRKHRRKFSSSGARRDEKLISEFCCFICTRLIFRAQVLRPCGCNVFCEECVPPNIDASTSACSTCSTPFEQALPYRTGNNIAEQMVRASFVTAEVETETETAISL